MFSPVGTSISLVILAAVGLVQAVAIPQQSAQNGAYEAINTNEVFVRTQLILPGPRSEWSFRYRCELRRDAPDKWDAINTRRLNPLLSEVYAAAARITSQPLGNTAVAGACGRWETFYNTAGITHCNLRRKSFLKSGVILLLTLWQASK